MGHSIRHALQEVKEHYTSLNWWRNRVFVPYVVGTATRFHPGWPGYGQAIHVMDEPWDNLLVLDACRADVFEEVADLSTIDQYRRVISLGSHSSEWTRRNFAGKAFGDTVYVSANPHTSLEASESFHGIVKMWEQEFDDDAGTVLAETMVEAALRTHSSYPDKRLIVHFMQPHSPFVGSDLTDVAGDRDRYWRAYRDNLEYVLQQALLLKNELPGRTVITADHGQIRVGRLLTALGINAHKPGLRFPGLVEVPWAVFYGKARRVVEGSTFRVDSDIVDGRLRQLGYKL